MYDKHRNCMTSTGNLAETAAQGEGKGEGEGEDREVRCLGRGGG